MRSKPARTIKRTLALEQFSDYAIRSVWETLIEHGWKGASYSQALGVILAAYYYQSIKKGLILDRESMTQLRKYLQGKPWTLADKNSVDKWIQTLAKRHNLDAPKIS